MNRLQNNYKRTWHTGRYAALLLILFFVGALAALLSPSSLLVRFEGSCERAEANLLLLLAIEGLLGLSPCAVFLCPTADLLFGAAAAREIQRTMQRAAMSGRTDIPRLAFLALLVTVHFLLCGAALDGSYHIRGMLRKNGHHSGHLLFSLYTCMLTGLSALLAALHIMNK